MSEEVAHEILTWTYAMPYDFYNNAPSPEAIHEMLSDSYFAVYDSQKGLVGFFCVGNSAQVPNEDYTYSPESIDIGLGVKPELTGQGYGFSFLSFVLSKVEEMHGTSQKRLTVAEFNSRAIHLYEKLGFYQTFAFTKGSTPFVVMLQNTPSTYEG